MSASPAKPIPPGSSEKELRQNREEKARETARRTAACYVRQDDEATGDMTVFSVTFCIEENSRRLNLPWSSYSRTETRHTSETEYTIYFQGSESFRITIGLGPQIQATLGTDFLDQFEEGIRSGTLKRVQDNAEEDFSVKIEIGKTDEDGNIEYQEW